MASIGKCDELENRYQNGNGEKPKYFTATGLSKMDSVLSSKDVHALPVSLSRRSKS